MMSKKFISNKEAKEIRQHSREQEKLMIEATDSYFEELGLSEELSGTTKNEKILFYVNFLDKTNRFVNLIEFHNIYFAELLNFMCDTDDKASQFLNEFYDKDDVVGSVWGNYRKHILNTRELDIDGKYIQKLIETKDWKNLWHTLQTLFLDVMSYLDMEYFIRRIDEGLSGEDIYNWFLKSKGHRLISITNFNVDYVKSVA